MTSHPSNDKPSFHADRDVDGLYQSMRARFGGQNPGANGYRSTGFFRREQLIVFQALSQDIMTLPSDLTRAPVIDIACGSGLMLTPWPGASERLVFGVDYNQQACDDARQNGVAILRGDAFNLPFANDSVFQMVNCQFLNQQQESARRPFLVEIHRCLKPGGRFVLLWRHADSLLHKTAHAILSRLDHLRGLPQFPQIRHPLAQIIDQAERVGFDVKRSGVTLPFSLGTQQRPKILKSENPLSDILGASNFLLLEKRRGV
ncbi:MAG: hypothetical protein CMM78_09045 [Rhodospirillaceae bacterium]|uniref:class I SAM-dependent methyltransferase n=1 Tax=Hwanghaeella sp. 1Z406 TaxID=3402811 RepID=UPI000C3879F5|nr:hypothetical protein [Rhodospirillales bacterium]MAX48341.1 hypothetical protein [Rhodospirillaceae bacterium]